MSFSAKAQRGAPVVKSAGWIEYGYVQTDSGFIPARITQAHRDSMVNPAYGLLIFQITGTTGYYYYNGSGWVLITPNEQVNYSFQSLSDNSTITWNTYNGLRPNASVTLGGTRNITISNINDGQTVQLFVTQDGVGGRDLIFPSGTFFINGSATGSTINLTNTAGALDVLSIMKKGSVLYVTTGYFHP